MADISANARFHTKRDGVLMIQPDGQARFLTLYERMYRHLTGRLPAKAKP